MKILVTGANGQLGRSLRRALERSELGRSVLYAAREDLDITDGEQLGRLIADNGVTHIVNCAAYTNVDRAEEEKAACMEANSEGVKRLAMAADGRGVKIIHISTDFVFDGRANRAYTESDKVNPLSHYGMSKRAGETALLALAPENSIIIRTSWLYGPDSDNNFPAKILRAARGGRQLKVVDDQIGSPTNSDDLAAAIVRILSTPQWFPGVYHYCNAGICSRYDFAKAILLLAGLDGEVSLTPVATSGDPAYADRPLFSALNTSKIRLTYGVETPHWIDSLRKAIK